LPTAGIIIYRLSLYNVNKMLGCRRDRAAWCVIVLDKVKTGTETKFNRHYRSIASTTVI